MLSRCKRCGTRIVAFKKTVTVLCRECTSFVEEDVAYRKSEIRKAMAAIRYSPSAPSIFIADAKSHLDVLLKYHSAGMAKVRPEPMSMLRRLDAFSAPHRERAELAPPPSAARASARKATETAGKVAGSPEPSWQETAFGFDAAQIDRAFENLTEDAFLLGQNPEEPPAEEAFPPLVMDTQEDEQLAISYEERRSSERRPVDFKLCIHPYGYQAVARNLSAGGLYLQTGSMKAYRKPFRLVFHTHKGAVETVGVVCRSDKRCIDEEGVAQEGLAIKFLGALKHLPDLRCESAELTLAHGVAP